MFFRYLLALCLITVFTVEIYAKAEKAELDDRSVTGKAVAKILAKIAAGMAASCLVEAGEHCKQFWNKPGEALNCGKEFFKDNKGRCAVGK